MKILIFVLLFATLGCGKPESNPDAGSDSPIGEGVDCRKFEDPTACHYAIFARPQKGTCRQYVDPSFPEEETWVCAECMTNDDCLEGERCSVNGFTCFTAHDFGSPDGG